MVAIVIIVYRVARMGHQLHEEQRAIVRARADGSATFVSLSVLRPSDAAIGARRFH